MSPLSFSGPPARPHFPWVLCHSLAQLCKPQRGDAFPHRGLLLALHPPTGLSTLSPLTMLHAPCSMRHRRPRRRNFSKLCTRHFGMADVIPLTLCANLSDDSHNAVLAKPSPRRVAYRSFPWPRPRSCHKSHAGLVAQDLFTSQTNNPTRLRLQLAKMKGNREP